MRRILTALSIFSIFFLLSCQKESGFSNTGSGTGGGGSSTGTRLIKMVNKAGQDSAVSEFSYNSSNKITGFKASGIQSGQVIDLRLSYVRNSSGIIQKQILKSNDLNALGVDSIMTIINYDGANNQYKTAVSVVSIFSLNVRDSIVFQYDGTGKLVSEIDYTDAGVGYMPSTKTEYSFSGSNLAVEKIYTYNAGTSGFDLQETYTYLYDAKINPLQFPADAPILNMDPFYSANNITKTTLVAADPADNYVSNDTYTYNTANRPATSTNISGTQSSTITYYYQ